MADGVSPADKLCPSSCAEPGATLLGAVAPGGRVLYLTPRTLVDAEFIEAAKQGRAPEKRFRFAGPCVTSGCVFWGEKGCGVAEAAVAGGPVSDRLPRCSIRAECRWFAQEGVAVCYACPGVVTDVSEALASQA